MGKAVTTWTTLDSQEGAGTGAARSISAGTPLHRHRAHPAGADPRGRRRAAQVLAALGAELNPVRQRVIRLLYGTQGTDERPGRRHRGLLPEILARVESIEAQLSGIGQRLGTGRKRATSASRSRKPRRGKQAAAGGEEDHENAAALRTGTATARRQDRPPAGVGSRTPRPCLPGRAAAPAGRGGRAVAGPSPPAGQRPAPRRRLIIFPGRTSAPKAHTCYLTGPCGICAGPSWNLPVPRPIARRGQHRRSHGA
jgi:hypothetical protein